MMVVDTFTKKQMYKRFITKTVVNSTAQVLPTVSKTLKTACLEYKLNTIFEAIKWAVFGLNLAN